MSVTGYQPAHIGYRAPDAGTDDRTIPAADFARLHERFRFTIDAAATPANARLPRYWTAGDNALTQSWSGERVWCNPPYSHPGLGRWTAKAWAAWKHPARPEVIVMLVPANRTEQAWWQANVEPWRDRRGPLRTEFLPGRIRFQRDGGDPAGPADRSPFGSCLLIWSDVTA